MVTDAYTFRSSPRINGHTLAPPMAALQRDGGAPTPDARCCDSVGGVRTAMYPNNGLPVCACSRLFLSYVAAAGAVLREPAVIPGGGYAYCDADGSEAPRPPRSELDAR